MKTLVVSTKQPFLERLDEKAGKLAKMAKKAIQASCLSFLTMVPFDSAQVFAQQMPGPNRGLPANATLQESYRKQTQTFFTLPDGVSIADFNDSEKLEMRSFATDELHQRGLDERGNPVFSINVLNPDIQFRPQDLPYSSVLLQGETTTFFREDGSVLHQVDNGPIPVNPYEGLSEREILEMIMRDGFKEPDFIPDGPFGPMYAYPGYQFYMDEGNGILTEIELDENNQWISKTITMYDLNDLERSVPLMRIAVTRHTFLSELCAFHVFMESFTEYMRVSEEETTPRALQEAALETALSEIQMWPNPVYSSLQVSIPRIDMDANVTMSIFSMDGKLVQEAVFQSESTQLVSLQNLQSGIYIVRWQTNGIVKADKLIKK